VNVGWLFCKTRNGYFTKYVITITQTMINGRVLNDNVLAQYDTRPRTAPSVTRGAFAGSLNNFVHNDGVVLIQCNEVWCVSDGPMSFHRIGSSTAAFGIVAREFS
jgi:hypothetical protein